MSSGLPDICPQCATVTHDLNVSVNVSDRDGGASADIDWTGDTIIACGPGARDELHSIGRVCPTCGREWADTDMIRVALTKLNLMPVHEDEGT